MAMSNELFPQDTINPSILDITDEHLPELNIRQQSMLNYIMAGYNATQAYRKAGYDSVDHADRAAWQVINSYPMKQYIENYRKALSKMITPEYIVDRVNFIVNRSLDDSNPLQFNPEMALKAIDTLNKMAGYYAAQNVNVSTVSASIEDVRNARQEYKKDR